MSALCNASTGFWRQSPAALLSMSRADGAGIDACLRQTTGQGANLQETILTQASVKAKGVRRVTIIPVFRRRARGLEAQAADFCRRYKLQKGLRDVMVLPSMANKVRGG